MTKHLTVGGSTAARTLACPPWVKRSADKPKQKAGVFAHEGSMLHEVMENVYDKGMTLKEQIGVTRHEKVVFSEDTVWLAEVAQEAAETLLDTLDIDELVVEPFVQIIPDYAGGSIDLLGLSADGKTVLVADWKFGQNPVEVVDNAQISFYALAAMIDPKTRDMFAKVERVVGAVIQPKVSAKALTWEFTLAELDAFEDKLHDTLDHITLDDAPAKTGAHCHYCPNAPYCEEKKALAMQALATPPAQAATLAEAMAMVADVEQWAKAVKKSTHEALERGGKIEGWKLVQKRASRVWNDIEAAEDKVRKLRGIKIDDARDYKLKTPPQMEKLFKAHKKDFGKMGEFVSAVSSGTTLAPESDKRAGVIKDVIPESLKKLVAESISSD